MSEIKVLMNCNTCAHWDEDRHGRICSACNRNDTYVDRYKMHQTIKSLMEQLKSEEPDAATPDPQ